MHSLLIVIGVLAAAAGPFLPRVIYRLSVAADEPWRSTCDNGHTLTPNLGRSWLGLARCRHPAGCGSYGPAAIPTSAITATASVLVTMVVGWRPELLAWLLVTPAAVVLATVDYRVHRLPDVLTLPAAGAVLTLLALAALLPGHRGSFASAMLGSCGTSAFFLLVVLVNPSGMGLGDVKLSLTTGALLGWYGWVTLIMGVFCALLLGAAYATALLLTGRAGWRVALPFAPMMFLGALLSVVMTAPAT